MNLEALPTQPQEKEPISEGGKMLQEAELHTTESLLGKIQERLKGVDDVQYAQFLIADSIETLLRYRVSKEAVVPLTESLTSVGFTEDEYASFIEKITELINQESNVACFHVAGWLACQALGENGNPEKFPLTDESEVAVIPKEYWTFAPLSQASTGWQVQAESFLQQLPKIIAYLRDELKLKFFGVKVPDQLNRLLRHRDSLVIHYPDESLRETLRARVDELLTQAGVEMDKGRSRLSGFDFQWKNSSRNEAYSTVMGKVVAHKLAEIAVATPEKIQDTEAIQTLLGQYSKEVEALDPKELLNQFMKC